MEEQNPTLPAHVGEPYVPKSYDRLDGGTCGFLVAFAVPVLGLWSCAWLLIIIFCKQKSKTRNRKKRTAKTERSDDKIEDGRRAEQKNNSAICSSELPTIEEETGSSDRSGEEPESKNVERKGCCCKRRDERREGGLDEHERGRKREKLQQQGKKKRAREVHKNLRIFLGATPVDVVYYLCAALFLAFVAILRASAWGRFGGTSSNPSSPKPLNSPEYSALYYVIFLVVVMARPRRRNDDEEHEKIEDEEDEDSSKAGTGAGGQGSPKDNDIEERLGELKNIEDGAQHDDEDVDALPEKVSEGESVPQKQLFFGEETSGAATQHDLSTTRDVEVGQQNQLLNSIELDNYGGTPSDSPPSSPPPAHHVIDSSTGSPPPKQRFEYIDSIKSFVIFGAVVYHSSTHWLNVGVVPGAIFAVYRSFGTGEVNASLSPLICAFVVPLCFYGMQILFFFAGYFSVSGLQKKGVYDFAKERLLKLGIPLIVVIFGLYPLISWFNANMLYKGRNANDNVQQVEGYLVTVQMGWFLYTLLQFSLFSCFVFAPPPPGADDPASASSNSVMSTRSYQKLPLPSFWAILFVYAPVMGVVTAACMALDFNIMDDLKVIPFSSFGWSTTWFFYMAGCLSKINGWLDAVDPETGNQNNLTMWYAPYGGQVGAVNKRKHENGKANVDQTSTTTSGIEARTSSSCIDENVSTSRNVSTAHVDDFACSEEEKDAPCSQVEVAVAEENHEVEEEIEEPRLTCNIIMIRVVLALPFVLAVAIGFLGPFFAEGTIQNLMLPKSSWRVSADHTNISPEQMNTYLKTYVSGDLKSLHAKWSEDMEKRTANNRFIFEKELTEEQKEVGNAKLAGWYYKDTSQVLYNLFSGPDPYQWLKVVAMWALPTLQVIMVLFVLNVFANWEHISQNSMFAQALDKCSCRRRILVPVLGIVFFIVLTGGTMIVYFVYTSCIKHSSSTSTTVDQVDGGSSSSTSSSRKNTPTSLSDLGSEWLAAVAWCFPVILGALGVLMCGFCLCRKKRSKRSSATRRVVGVDRSRTTYRSLNQEDDTEDEIKKIMEDEEGDDASEKGKSLLLQNKGMTCKPKKTSRTVEKDDVTVLFESEGRASSRQGSSQHQGQVSLEQLAATTQEQREHLINANLKRRISNQASCATKPTQTSRRRGHTTGTKRATQHLLEKYPSVGSSFLGEEYQEWDEVQYEDRRMSRTNTECALIINQHATAEHRQAPVDEAVGNIGSLTLRTSRRSNDEHCRVSAVVVEGTNMKIKNDHTDIKAASMGLDNSTGMTEEQQEDNWVSRLMMICAETSFGVYLVHPIIESWVAWALLRCVLEQGKTGSEFDFTPSGFDCPTLLDFGPFYGRNYFTFLHDTRVTQGYVSTQSVGPGTVLLGHAWTITFTVTISTALVKLLKKVPGLGTVL